MNVITLTKDTLNQYLPEMISIDKYYYETLGNTFDMGPWGEPNFNMELPNKWELSCVYIHNNKLIGYLIASQKEDKCHIHRVVVIDKYHNLGISYLLWSYTYNSSHNKGINHYSVNVNVYNTNAIEFYERIGFKNINVYEESDGSKYYVMEQ